MSRFEFTPEQRRLTESRTIHDAGFIQNGATFNDRNELILPEEQIAALYDSEILAPAAKKLMSETPEGVLLANQIHQLRRAVWSIGVNLYDWTTKPDDLNKLLKTSAALDELKQAGIDVQQGLDGDYMSLIGQKLDQHEKMIFTFAKELVLYPDFRIGTKFTIDHDTNAGVCAITGVNNTGLCFDFVKLGTGAVCTWTTPDFFNHVTPLPTEA